FHRAITLEISTRSLLDALPIFGIDLEFIGPFIPTLEQGRVAAALALKQHPTAIMGFNDQLATGIIQYLLSEGYEVPGDISVTGRSEEHTSELQSRFDLVCRLLL